MKYSILIVVFVGLFLYLKQVKISTAHKLLEAENNKIYFGAFPDFGGSEDTVTEERIRSFENLVGKKMAWAQFSQNWFNGLVYPQSKIQTLSDMGVMPYIRLMPRSSLKQFEIENHFTLDRIINGDFDIELKKWAEDAKKHNIPLIIDFAVEMNGNWFGWSGFSNGAETKKMYGDPSYYDGPEKYRDAYRHIIDVFREKNAHNVTWFFHPNAMSIPNEEWNSPKYYYPGDAYIDWIGISIYGALSPKEIYWNTFDEILEDNYQQILNISSVKPLAILEMGVTDSHHLGKKDKWLKDAFKTILTQKYLKFNAINYWHESWDDNGVVASLKVDSSLNSLTTFTEAINNDRFTSKVNLSK